MPAIHYPQGYSVEVDGGEVVSAAGAGVLRIRNNPGAAVVNVTLSRVGLLPALQQTSAEADRNEAALAALPPIPNAALTRHSLLGHIVVTPGGRALLDEQVPGMLAGMAHVHGWEKMTLAGIQQFASGVLTEQRLAEIDRKLAALKVTPGRVQAGVSRLSIDSLTSDLLADPRTRAIIDREAPGLATSTQQGLFPQTRLRDLRPAMPEILTEEVLQRIDDGLRALP